MANNITPAPLVNGFVPGALGTLYTVPASQQAVIQQMAITNTDVVNAHKVSIYLSPNSNPGSTSDLIWSGTLSPGQSYSVYQAIGQVLAAGGTIQAFADAATTVNMIAGGLLVS